MLAQCSCFATFILRLENVLVMIDTETKKYFSSQKKITGDLMENDIKLNKAFEYLKIMKFEDDVIDMMVQIHYMLAPQAPAVAWTELFSGLDYTYVVESQAKRLAESFTEEELDEVLIFSKSPTYQKIVRMRADDLEIEEENNKWFIRIKEDFLSRAKYVFNKHKVDSMVYETLVKSIQDLERQ